MKVYLILPEKYPRVGGETDARKKIRESNLVVDASALGDDDLAKVINELRARGATMLNSPFS